MEEVEAVVVEERRFVLQEGCVMAGKEAEFHSFPAIVGRSKWKGEADVGKAEAREV